ncbi:DUF7314 family protein [Halorarum halobium]|uniref:DUF7314 family protein n=1 Tax=Halorarum halobium TaxID=3075121 RepID=UPI0028AF9FD2|nr:hypothetical protein [Halobaculum sp. XH14]
MADEFIKGLGLFTGAGLAWMVLASWYRTESFESSNQLIAPPPEPSTTFGAVGIFLNDVFFWTAILGGLTFWVLVPAARELGAAYQDRQQS